MVGKQFTTLGKLVSINRIGDKNFGSGIAQGRHDHQRDNEFITAGDLGDEKDASQGCMQHPGDQSAHAYHSEVRSGQVG